jgi:hypothetical protein
MNSSPSGIADGREDSATFSRGSPSPTPARRTTHSAVVQAMITSNNLRNCREVEDMVAQCASTVDKESFVCKTAHRYFVGCQEGPSPAVA